VNPRRSIVKEAELSRGEEDFFSNKAKRKDLGLRLGGGENSTREKSGVLGSVKLDILAFKVAVWGKGDKVGSRVGSLDNLRPISFGFLHLVENAAHPVSSLFNHLLSVSQKVGLKGFNDRFLKVLHFEGFIRMHLRKILNGK